MAVRRKKAATRKKATTRKKAPVRKRKPARLRRKAPSPDVEVDEATGAVARVVRSKTRAGEPSDEESGDGIERDDAWLPWYDEYLVALAKEFSHGHASAVVGLTPRTTQRHRKKHAGFAAACAAAWEEVVDELEASAMKRAIKGNVEPIMYKDKPVGAKRTFETALTIYMLKQNRREKYGQDGSYDERDARERAREFREALRAMDESIPSAQEE